MGKDGRVHHRPVPPVRRAAITVCVIVLAVLAPTACTTDAAPGDASAAQAIAGQVREPGAHTVTLSADDPAELALAASRLLFDRSPVLVVAGLGDAAAAPALGTVASALDAPALLVDGPDDRAVSSEADRLGARLAVVVEEDRLAVDGTDPAPSNAQLAARAAGLTVFQIDPQAAVDSGARSGPTAQARLSDELREDVDEASPGVLPDVRPTRLTEVLALVDPAPGQEAALATLRAAGAVTQQVPGGDPGADEATVHAVADARALTVIGVGPGFADPQTFAWRVASAETDVLLPNGTQRVNRARFAAVETRANDAPQDVLAESVDTTGDPALTPAVVVRANQRLWTRGAAGTYVRAEPVESLTAMVQAVRGAGRYVVLDLEGGAVTLLDQVRALDPLLAQGGVGVLVHPEQRRSGAGRDRGGAVTAAELDAVVDHLAELATKHSLPQILVAVHSFDTAVEDAGSLTSRPQVAVADSTVLEGLP
jgi:hypothetical protein